jgi:CubicO group peptidase (beta-lactamase class C family)
VIAERYLPPVSVDTPMQGWSMNKSLVATWVGIQVKQERLSLDLPVLQALRASGAELGEIEHKIEPTLTLFNLLHMESGFDFVETYKPGDDATHMLYESPVMWQVAPGKGHIYSPGEHFSYSSGDTNLATFLWQTSLMGQPYPSWMEENFWGPIGLRSVTSEADSSGVQVGSSYTYMTARDWGRLGQFWLDAWHNRNDLLPQGWQGQATQPSASNIQGNYGLGFWLNTQGSALPSLPKNLFYAGGHAGQRVIVLPDEELVIVRLGLSQSGVDLGVEAFVRQLLDVLNRGTL